jgi:hypothetical protein
MERGRLPTNIRDRLGLCLSDLRVYGVSHVARHLKTHAAETIALRWCRHGAGFDRSRPQFPAS